MDAGVRFRYDFFCHTQWRTKAGRFCRTHPELVDPLHPRGHTAKGYVSLTIERSLPRTIALPCPAAGCQCLRSRRPGSDWEQRKAAGQPKSR